MAGTEEKLTTVLIDAVDLSKTGGFQNDRNLCLLNPHRTSKCVTKLGGFVRQRNIVLEDPRENGYVEFFNSKLRYELINREVFTILLEANL